MRLTRLSMKSFAPFADGEMSFPAVPGREGLGLAEVHLFTGENGTGKTRVLAALMGALGNLGPLQERVRQDAGTELEVDAEWDDVTWRFVNGMEDPKTPCFPLKFEIYSDLHAMGGCGVALLSEPRERLGREFKPAKAAESLILSGPVGGVGLFQRLEALRMGVALERDASPGSEGRLARSLRSLEETVKEITGHEFALQVRPGTDLKLMADWDGQRLYFSELPDGLRSLLNWLAGWVVLQTEFFESKDRPLEAPVTLILDEPENHLHPAWQRRVLPAVQRLFPDAQMFVVTHSPFVVSSLNVGWIHKFTRGEDGKVSIEDAQRASLGDSYMTAVQEVLDVSEWFDPETEEELENFDRLLEDAYAKNGASVEAMREKAAALKQRSQEVTNLVAGLEAQFDRNMEARRRRASMEKEVNDGFAGA